MVTVRLEFDKPLGREEFGRLFETVRTGVEGMIINPGRYYCSNVHEAWSFEKPLPFKCAYRTVQAVAKGGLGLNKAKINSTGAISRIRELAEALNSNRCNFSNLRLDMPLGVRLPGNKHPTLVQFEEVQKALGEYSKAQTALADFILWLNSEGYIAQEVDRNPNLKRFVNREKDDPKVSYGTHIDNKFVLMKGLRVETENPKRDIEFLDVLEDYLPGELFDISLTLTKK